ncbi:hypothetical protein LINPERHAP1_LOCUS24253, partial [Linum perenne]
FDRIGLTNFSVVANWPGSYERCISVRFKSRFRLSSHPTRFIGIWANPWAVSV